jgi:SHS2 domain-containing protein
MSIPLVKRSAKGETD